MCLFVLYVEQEEVMGPVSVWPSSVDPDCPQPALGPARPATRAAVPVRGVMTLTVSLTDSGWWWWWWWQAQLMPPSPDWVDDTPSGDTRRVGGWEPGTLAPPRRQQPVLNIGSGCEGGLQPATMAVTWTIRGLLTARLILLFTAWLLQSSARQRVDSLSLD